MAYAARYEFGLFDGEDDETDAFLSLRTVMHGCTFLYACNVEYFLSKFGQDRTKVPNLYDTPVYYKTPENACGGDVWQSAKTLLERGYGDCKDLACYLAAQRTVRDGIHAVPKVKRKWFSGGFALYHIVVQHTIGCECGYCDENNEEDPSIVLGMPVEAGA